MLKRKREREKRQMKEAEGVWRFSTSVVLLITHAACFFFRLLVCSCVSLFLLFFSFELSQAGEGEGSVFLLLPSPPHVSRMRGWRCGVVWIFFPLPGFSLSQTVDPLIITIVIIHFFLLLYHLSCFARFSFLFHVRVCAVVYVCVESRDSEARGKGKGRLSRCVLVISCSLFILWFLDKYIIC